MQQVHSHFCGLMCWNTLRLVFPAVVFFSLILSVGLNGQTATQTAGNAVSNGTGVVWMTPGNAISSDNAYATASLNDNTSAFLELSDFGFSIPAGAVITGIEVSIERSVNNTGNRAVQDNIIQLLDNTGAGTGNNQAATTTDWPGTDGVAVYGGSTDLWGTTWSAADINDADFGLQIQVKGQTPGNSTVTARVDWVQIGVYYTLPSCPDITAVSFTPAGPLCPGEDFTVTVTHDADVGAMEVIYGPAGLSVSQIYASTNVLTTITPANATAVSTTSGNVSLSTPGTYTLYARLAAGNPNFAAGSCEPTAASGTQLTIHTPPGANDVTLEQCDTRGDGEEVFDLFAAQDPGDPSNASGTDVDDGTTNTVSFHTASPALPDNQLFTGLVITGIIDGPLTGGLPKAIEVFATCDIPDLSIYGLGAANNGGGSDGEEFTFPAVAASAGQYIYVASESTSFTAYFGFAPDYISGGPNGAATFNGDDAIELFQNGQVVDIYGEVTHGPGTPSWDYNDRWVYRVSNTGLDGTTHVAANWTIAPADLTGATNNTANHSMPVGTYQGGACHYVGTDGETLIALVTDNNGCTAEAVITLSLLNCADYGDLPNDGAGGDVDYAVALLDNGPSHLIDANLIIGATIDDETNGTASPNADGDDNTAGLNVTNPSTDDEDGVDLTNLPFSPGNMVNVPVVVTNNTGSDATLYAFIDWNKDGDFADMGEAVTLIVASSAAPQTLLVPFAIPSEADGTAINLTTGARFRLTTEDLSARGSGDELWEGPANDGEVEDYIISISCPNGNCLGVDITTNE